MPINIVRIEEIGDCVQQVLDDLNAKCWAMNQRGHFVEMPEELKFDMLVVKEWEALESTDRETSIGSETQGGFSTEATRSGGTDISSSTEDRRSDGANSHTENGDSTTTYKQG